MTNTDITELQEILSREGLAAGLEFLNHRVPYRCTAVYQLNHGNIDMLALVDKLHDPSTAALPAVAFAKSFCQAVASGGPLMTSNSAQEARLDGKTYQGVIVSYVGLPLASSTGELFGTLCHYDFAEQSISYEEFEFLQQAALVLPAHISRAIK